MKIGHRIVHVFLCLLPILPILLFTIGNIGSDSGIDYRPLGDITIVVAGDTAMLSYDSDTILGDFLSPFIQSGIYFGSSNQFIYACLHLIYNLQMIGLPPLLIFPLFYLIYIAFLELLTFVVRLLTFIPRRCFSWLS